MTGPSAAGPSDHAAVIARVDSVLDRLSDIERRRDWANLNAICDHLGRDGSQALLFAERAFHGGRFLIGGLLAERAVAAGVQALSATVIAATLAALQGDADRTDRWRRELADRVARIDAGSLRALTPVLAQPVGQLAVQFHAAGDRPRLLLFSEVLATLIPDLHGAFGDLPGSRLPAVADRIPARRATRLTFDPTERAPEPVRVILAGREHWGDERSKLHEIEPRIHDGMAAYGWQVDRRPIRNIFSRTDMERTYESILAAHKANPAAAIFIDHAGLGPYPLDIGLFEWLRRETAGAKLVFYYLDAWQTEGWDRMRAVAPFADSIWTVFPILDLWDEPAFADKMTYVPIPMGVDPDRLPAPGPLGEPTFQGSIMWANIPRLFWLDGMAALDRPITVKRSDWGEVEELSAIDSYAAYLSRLAATGLNLNFCLRTTGERIFTGRTLEVPFVGTLLLQERAADVDCYLDEGTHYLGFETLTELAEKLDWVRAHPDEAAAIRDAGCRFVRESYADRRLIGALDRAIFG